MFTIISLAIWLVSIGIAITIHELAHAYAADKLGDPTARLMGRITLNPIKHYDPVGTTMLIATAAFAAFGAPIIPIGWAKPVMFDPYNLDKPKRDTGIIAVAGPLSNILMAIAMSLLFRLFIMEIPLLNLLAISFITINVSLAIFNLIPIHPLDGSKILYSILPNDLAREFQSIMSRYGMFLLIFLIIPFGGQSAASAFITPIILFFLNILLPGAGF